MSSDSPAPTRQARIIDALAETASEWEDEDHPSRSAAVQKTLDAPNRFTEKSVEYALRHQLSRLSPEAVTAWLGGTWTEEPATVGVRAAGETPFDALRDAVAVWGTGHRLVLSVADASPALLPAFVESMQNRRPDLPVSIVDHDALLERADAVIAQPEAEEREALEDACDAHGIPPARRHIRRPVYSVGVIDGQESEEEREDLAADMLLHEGKGRARLALLWAPRDLSPDPYLEAMAQFRGAVPAHDDTPGALQMQQAFLEAQDVSHAYAAGLQFLVSRADPEVQPAGHVRWTEYDDPAEADAWLQEHADDLYALVAREGLHDTLPPVAPILRPGEAHGAPVDDREGEAVVRYLAGL
jgi:hypothetical protein